MKSIFFSAITTAGKCGAGAATIGCAGNGAGIIFSVLLKQIFKIYFISSIIFCSFLILINLNISFFKLILLVLIYLYNRKYYNIYKNIFNWFIYYFSLNFINTSIFDIFNLSFNDVDYYKWLGLLVSMCTTIFTWYITIKYFKDLYQRMIVK